jgi:hypothetical protein
MADSKTEHIRDRRMEQLKEFHHPPYARKNKLAYAYLHDDQNKTHLSLECHQKHDSVPNFSA